MSVELTSDDVIGKGRPARKAQPVPAPTPKSRWKQSEAADWWIFWLLIGGVAWVPLWYASNDLITWGINALLFPGLAVAYEVSLLVRGKAHPVSAKQIWLPIVLFVAVVVWIVLQNATWTPASWHHPIWSLTEDALKKPVEGSISVNRDATVLALVRLLTAASVFWVALQLCRNTKRASHFMTALVIIVSVYSAFGLIDFAFLQSENTKSRSFVTSTFANHNHFADYAGIGLVAVSGLILKIYQREAGMEGGSLRFRIGNFLETTAQRAVLLFGGAFLIFVALLLTGSRGGIVASGLGVFALATLILGQHKGSASERRMIVILGAAVVAATLLAFGDSLIFKITEGGLSDQNRMAVYLITLQSILDAPLFGYGYGTFADVFPMFRDRSLSVLGTWEQAHNTYLEVFQGLGIVFGLALVSCVGLLVLRCFKGATTRRDSVLSSIAASVAFLLGIHALADFSLQIQAVTLTFMAVLGVGVAQSWSSRLSVND